MKYGLAVFSCTLALLLGDNGFIRADSDLPEENLQECIDPSDFDPERDYFPHKVTVEVAEHFSVEYFKHYKIVRNVEDDQTYVLVQCGAPHPDPPIAGAAFVLDVPLTSVALQYSTMEAFFEVLGNRRTVQAILGTSYSTSLCMKDLIASGNIVELNDMLASLDAGYVNQKGLLANSPNLEAPFSSDTLVGFVGRTPWNQKTYPFPFVRTSDTLEPSLQGLFETTKFYATFLNKEARANEVWDQVQTRLDCVQTNAETVAVERKLNFGEESKTILWATYSRFCGGVWDVARTGPFYYNDFAQVCSTTLLTAENGGTVDVPTCSSERKFMTMAEFVEFGKDADVWIYPGASSVPLNDAEIFTDEIKASFKSFRDQEIYDSNGSEGWFDQAFIQPGAYCVLDHNERSSIPI